MRLRLTLIMIRFITCARRNNGKIIGVGTVQRNDLGQDEHQFWTAAKIREVQDTIEMVSYHDPVENMEKTLDRGPYQFLVENKDSSRSVDVKADCDSEGCFIQEPAFSDRDLVLGLQECLGDYPASND